MTDQLELAIQIAKKAHKGQTDRAGEDYILHVKEVIAGVSKYGKNAMTVAALHDVVEDSSITLSDLKKYGFSDSILISVKLLTRTKDVQESEYYERIKNNPLARVVKISDLKHNSDTSRIVNPNKADKERTDKYISKLKYLTH
jgi:(p)ppGpp synthase/HD superfamily hydrolase